VSYAIFHKDHGAYRGHWPNPRTGKVVPHYTWHRFDLAKQFADEGEANKCIEERGLRRCSVKAL